MLLTYQPDGTDPQTFTFRPRKLRSAEAEAVERATGMTLGEFGVAFLKGSMLANRAAVWVLLRREQPDLKFAAVDLCADDLKVEFEPDEADALRDALADTPEVDEQQREYLLRLLARAEAAPPNGAAPVRVAPAGEDDGPFGRAATA